MYTTVPFLTDASWFPNHMVYSKEGLLRSPAIVLDYIRFYTCSHARMYSSKQWKLQRLFFAPQILLVHLITASGSSAFWVVHIRHGPAAGLYSGYWTLVSSLMCTPFGYGGSFAIYLYIQTTCDKDWRISTTPVIAVHMHLWSCVSHTQSPRTYIPFNLCVHGTGSVDRICSLGHFTLIRFFCRFSLYWRESGSNVGNNRVIRSRSGNNVNCFSYPSVCTNTYPDAQRPWWCLAACLWCHIVMTCNLEPTYSYTVDSCFMIVETMFLSGHDSSNSQYPSLNLENLLFLELPLCLHICSCTQCMVSWGFTDNFCTDSAAGS